MRPHHSTNSEPRPWQVITHHDNDQAERCEAVVQAIQSYELALHAFRVGLEQHERSEALSVELRDPSGRCILDSNYNLPNPDFIISDDGLTDAESGRYAWIDNEEAHLGGRFVPVATLRK